MEGQGPQGLGHGQRAEQNHATQLPTKPPHTTHKGLATALNPKPWLPPRRTEPRCPAANETTPTPPLNKGSSPPTGLRKGSAIPNSAQHSHCAPQLPTTPPLTRAFGHIIPPKGLVAIPNVPNKKHCSLAALNPKP